MSTKLEVVKNYLSLLEDFSTEPSKYVHVLHPEIEQTEYPNLITPKTKVRNVQMLLEGMAAGKQLLRSQSYEIQNTIESTDHLVVEVIWKGTVNKDLGPFKESQVLVATFCVVMEFKDGLIYRQRNYDCFEPFS
jgi:ketosteroid isomerase-like protein